MVTTLSVCILLLVYFIPGSAQKELPTNLEVEYITSIATNSIYLQNSDGHLVQAKILIDEKDLDKKVEKMVNHLIVSKSNPFPNSLKALIPENTKILNITVEESIVTLNFSKEFATVLEKDEEAMIESLVYSVLDIEGITGLKLKVEGEDLLKLPQSKKSLPEILTKKIGINKVYNIDSRKNLNSVVIYYVESIDGNNYYVPVTKYLNDSRDKIKIVMENLTTNYIYEKNLISFLSEDVSLIDYNIDNDIMVLNFNDAIFTNDKNIMEEVVYTICSSVFANYDVREVVLQVQGLPVVSKSVNNMIN